MRYNEKRKVRDDQKAKNILNFGFLLMNSFVLQGAKVQKKFGICFK